MTATPAPSICCWNEELHMIGHSSIEYKRRECCQKILCHTIHTFVWIDCVLIKLIYTFCFQDRAALMSLILEDESKRQKLNGITHPRIFRRMLWEIAGFASRGHNYAVLDVPLLFESSGRLVKWFHKIIGDIYVPKCWVEFSFNQAWLQFKGNPWLFLVLKLQTSEPSKKLRVKLFYYYLSTYSALFNGYYIHLNTLYGKKWWWKRSRKH